ncbi:hypothetical protein N8482_02610 [Chitinophagales bacterium]|nr:hypothetical protein [Chitinophagales bacterium]
MKGFKLPIFLVVLLLAIVYYAESTRPPIHNWSESYNKESKDPYGTLVLHDLLPEFFSGSLIEEIDKPVYNQLVDTVYENSAYLVLLTGSRFDDLDGEYLMNFVAEGNTAFIAAGRDMLNGLDELSISLEGSYDYLYAMTDTMGICDQYEVEGNDEYYLPSKMYGGYFTGMDSGDDRLLKDENGESVLVRVNHGKGVAYFFSCPLSLTNYALLNDQYRPLSELALSYIDADHIMVDNYYRPANSKSEDLFDENYSVFSVIRKSPALSWLMYLIAAAVAAFMLIGAKRKQRAIPIVEPPRNTIIDFVETVGMLYYRDKGHKGLALKKLRHFSEYLRRNYYLREIETTEENALALSAKTGMTVTKVQLLFRILRAIQNREEIFDTDLVKISSLIDELYIELGSPAYQ